VGSFRTALFNWLFARQQKGVFILRIEDTDRIRSKDEFLESQLADLKWMGLDWDEGPQKGGDFGPYFQSQRLEIYNKYAQTLIDEGKAYHCYCSPEELKQERMQASSTQDESSFGYSGKCRDLSESQKSSLLQEGRTPCIRFRIPSEGTTIVKDLIKGEVPFENRLMEDFVIMKSDGIPTYNFAVVVDDHLMKISHVIRGDEHMSNTPRQVLLYEALNFESPIFCHIPIILNPDRTKLSKRKGAVHLLEFRDRGYLKEAILNFLALLGWAPKDDKEIFSLEELKQIFSIDGITKHPAVFDENKLIWMNGQYMSIIQLDELIEQVKIFLKKISIDTESKDIEWYRKAVTLYKDRMKTLVEFADNLEYFFNEVTSYDPKGVAKHFKYPFLENVLFELSLKIQKENSLDEAKLESIIRNYAEELNQPAAKIIHAVRLACTGRTATPPIFDVMMLMGREKLIRALQKAADFINQIQKSEVPS
jgi:glutamyl-tRNA synthetase